MQIRFQAGPDFVELVAEGLLDNESSRDFRAKVDEAVREGHDRILVNMAQVSYLSSAGISVLLDCHKQLDAIHGYFAICDVAPVARRILELTRVYERLAGSREAASGGVGRPRPSTGSKSRVIQEPGIDLEVIEVDAGGSLTCQTFGFPGRLFDAAFSDDDCRGVAFPASTFGLGLGAFGDSFDACRSRFGEFVGVAGGVAQSPTGGVGASDYQLASEGFVPEVQVLYGLACRGEFSHVIRFRAADSARPVSFSRLVEVSLDSVGHPQAGLVVLGECVGLVGAVLRRTPLADGAAGGRFDFPQIRDWISFGAEQVFRRSLALVAGVARRESAPEADPLAPFLRAVDDAGKVSGHFHAAAFPYRPLRKASLELRETAAALFDSGTLQGVLHLLNDARPLVGAGETQFLQGTCWAGPIRHFVHEAVH